MHVMVMSGDRVLWLSGNTILVLQCLILALATSRTSSAVLGVNDLNFTAVNASQYEEYNHPRHYGGGVGGPQSGGQAMALTKDLMENNNNGADGLSSTPRTLGFRVQPPTSALVTPGSPLSIPCLPNKRDWKIRWTRGLDDGENIPRIERNGPENRFGVLQNGTLYFDEVLPSDEGDYRCQVAGPKGVLMAHRTEVILAGPGRWLLEPQNVSAIPDGAVRLTCYLYSKPLAEITWMRGNVTVTSSDRHYFPSPGVLQINPVQPSDVGEYRCAGYNPSLEDTHLSSPGHVTLSEGVSDVRANGLSDDEDSDVEGSASANQRDAKKASKEVVPKLLLVQYEVTVGVGEKAVLECLSNVGVKRLGLVWSRAGKSHSEVIDLRDHRYGLEGHSNLVIRDARATDSGRYNCTLQGSERHPSVTQFVTLIVQTVPTVAVEPPRDNSYNELQAEEMNCTAEGNPRPRLSWYKDGVKINHQPNHYELEQTRSRNQDGEIVWDETFLRLRLKVFNLQNNDTGLYQCVATNEAGEASATRYINASALGFKPDTPTNLSFKWTGLGEAKVSWDPLEISVNMDQVGYIAYTKTDPFVKNYGDSQIFENVVHEPWVVLSSLEKNKLYEVYVKSFMISFENNDKPYISDSSDSIFLISKSRVPLISPTTMVDNITPHSLLLHWRVLSKSQLEGSRAMSHKILYRRASDATPMGSNSAVVSKKRKNIKEILVPANVYSYNVTGLQPLTEYEFQVLTANEGGYPDIVHTFTWLHVATTGPHEGQEEQEEGQEEGKEEVFMEEIPSLLHMTGSWDYLVEEPLLSLKVMDVTATTIQVSTNPELGGAGTYNRIISWQCWKMTAGTSFSTDRREIFRGDKNLYINDVSFSCCNVTVLYRPTATTIKRSKAGQNSEINVSRIICTDLPPFNSDVSNMPTVGMVEQLQKRDVQISHHNSTSIQISWSMTSQPQYCYFAIYVHQVGGEGVLALPLSQMEDSFLIANDTIVLVEEDKEPQIPKDLLSAKEKALPPSEGLVQRSLEKKKEDRIKTITNTLKAYENSIAIGPKWKLIVSGSSALLTDLSPRTTYNIQVKACSFVDCADYSPKIWGFTISGLSTPPRDVSWRPVSASQVSVSWRPPLLTLLPTPTHYRLTFSSDNKTWREVAVDFNTTSTELDFLVSNTNYSVYIAAARKKADVTKPANRLSFSGDELYSVEEIKDRQVNDDPFWEEDYIVEDDYSDEELEEEEVWKNWESVGEWASTFFIVHAVIISEAEKWPSDISYIMMILVSVAVAITSIGLVVLCWQLFTIRRNATTILIQPNVNHVRQSPPPPPFPPHPDGNQRLHHNLVSNCKYDQSVSAMYGHNNSPVEVNGSETVTQPLLHHEDYVRFNGPTSFDESTTETLLDSKGGLSHRSLDTAALGTEGSSGFSSVADPDDDQLSRAEEINSDLVSDFVRVIPAMEFKQCKSIPQLMPMLPMGGRRSLESLQVSPIKREPNSDLRLEKADDGGSRSSDVNRNIV